MPAGWSTRSPAAPPADAVAWNAALAAFVDADRRWRSARIVLRHLAFLGIIRLTLHMMADIAADAFHRVQRFSTDWHANTFAGSTVRKITRGMWALDLLNDTILVALLPSVVMLVGSAVLLGSYWPVMGLVVVVGALVYIGVTVGAVARLCRAGGAARQPGTRGSAARSPMRSAATRWSRPSARRRARTRASRGRRQMATPHAPHLAARHHQRHGADRDAAGAARRDHRHRAVALVGGQATPATSPTC